MAKLELTFAISPPLTIKKMKGLEESVCSVRPRGLKDDAGESRAGGKGSSAPGLVPALRSCLVRRGPRFLLAGRALAQLPHRRPLSKRTSRSTRTLDSPVS